MLRTKYSPLVVFPRCALYLLEFFALQVAHVHSLFHTTRLLGRATTAVAVLHRFAAHRQCLNGTSIPFSLLLYSHDDARRSRPW